MSKDDYGCTRAACPSRFTTAEARDQHAAQEHKPCPFGCGQSFVAKGLGQHVKKCVNNPEGRGKLHCSHGGCTAAYCAGEEARLAEHEAVPHEACVCGAMFAISSLRKHQVRCPQWLAMQAAERDGLLTSWICQGCDEEIVTGEHYMTITVQLDSRMPTSYVPVRELDPTVITDVFLHGPACLVMWTERNELITNVFGEGWGAQTRRYLLETTRSDEQSWVSLLELIQKLTTGEAGHSFGKLVKEYDGLVRSVTPAEYNLMRDLLERSRLRAAARN